MRNRSVRAGGYVDAAPSTTAARRALLVTIKAPIVLIEGSLVSGVGFRPEHARTATGWFADKLEELTDFLGGPRRGVAVGEPLVRTKPSSADSAAGLHLDEATGLDFLAELRHLGAGLRGQLSSALSQTLKKYGFPAEADADEPGLTFLEPAGPLTPWEMLYEGSPTADVDWRQFWGFRTPISHWVLNASPSTDALPLRGGLFAGSVDDLATAGQDLGGFRPRTLVDALRDRVQEGLVNQLTDTRRVQNWWDDPLTSAIGWLKRYLDALPSNVQRDDWKTRALVRCFSEPRNPADLIHFGCHCEPDPNSPGHSRFTVRIAGELVTIDGALMNTVCRRATANHAGGPLVFLNGCGTSGQQPPNEAPGLAEQWITNGARAVVATVCAVPDSFAHAFARKFYDLLLEPTPTRTYSVAEALLATRRYFMETYHNPLGLAYVLYAWKGAHVAPTGWEVDR